MLCICRHWKVDATRSSSLVLERPISSSSAFPVPSLRALVRFSRNSGMAFVTCSRRPLSISSLRVVTRSSSTSRYCFRRRRDSLADSLFLSSRFCRRFGAPVDRPLPSPFRNFGDPYGGSDAAAVPPRLPFLPSWTDGGPLPFPPVANDVSWLVLVPTAALAVETPRCGTLIPDDAIAGLFDTCAWNGFGTLIGGLDVAGGMAGAGAGTIPLALLLWIVELCRPVVALPLLSCGM